MPTASAQLADMEFLPGPLLKSRTPVITDLSGTGTRDLLLFTAGQVQDEVGVLRETSLGTYALAQTLVGNAEGLIRLTLLADDMDLDGDDDLWISEIDGQGMSHLTAYRNQGFGPLTPGVSYPIDLPAETILKVDVDGDGVLDLSLSNSATSGFLRGVGDGTYLPFVPYFPQGLNHGNLLVGDFDGDGDQDFLGLSVIVFGGTLRAVQYENNGVFPIDPASGVWIQGIFFGTVGTLRDLDADGDLDAIIRTSGAFVELFENVAGAMIKKAPVLTGFPQSEDFAIEDVDGDGSFDVLFTRNGDLLWRANGPGIDFAPETILEEGEVVPVIVEDFSGDGQPDYLFLQSTEAVTRLDLRLGELQGGLPKIADGEVGLVDSPGLRHPTVFDANGDGFEDLAFTHPVPLETGPWRLSWKRATGDSSYALAQPLIAVPAQTLPPVGGDFTGDGFDDLLYSPAGSTELALLSGDGDGGFDQDPTVTPLPSVASSLTRADLDQDGIADIIVTRSNGSSVGVMQGTSTGVFGAMKNVVGNFPGPVVPVPMEANGDGRLDLLFATGNVVELALQSASGGFPSRSVVANANQVILELATDDIDGDGQADLVILTANDVRLAQGLGAGSFGPLTTVLSSTGVPLSNLTLLPIDSGPSPDLVVIAGNRLAAVPRWAPNLGGLLFGSPQPVLGSVIEGAIRSLIPVDADGDGDRDLLSTTNSSAYVLTQNRSNQNLGDPYCGPAVPNSSGLSASMAATGSTDLAINQFTLSATNLPQSQFGFFVNSRTQGLVTSLPDSMGTLCLSGAIGRFNRAGEILSSGLAGTFSLEIDLTSIPTPGGDVAVNPGETWHFQAWFRDIDGMGGTTSNFTDGLRVVF